MVGWPPFRLVGFKKGAGGAARKSAVQLDSAAACLGHESAVQLDSAAARLAHKSAVQLDSAALRLAHGLRPMGINK
ncbi:hypothetical protein DWZ56_16865 [Lachnotalea sp. AF33-28]|nr:hypothetical protein DWZ56_16865 [Lachnotalea sp. AF33-28]